MEKDLINLFVGSDIEASYIASLLEENGIPYILRNTMNEGLVAGWASASPDSSCTILVESDSFDKAKSLLNTYNDTMSQSESNLDEDKH